MRACQRDDSQEPRAFASERGDGRYPQVGSALLRESDYVRGRILNSLRLSTAKLLASKTLALRTGWPAAIALEMQWSGETRANGTLDAS